MTEQQIQAMKLGLEALGYWAMRDEFHKQTNEAITALTAALADNALDKKAELPCDSKYEQNCTACNAQEELLAKRSAKFAAPCPCGKQTNAWCMASTCSKAEQPAQKPSHDQMMAGYKVACGYGVMEARAFDLAEKMFVAMSAAEQPARQEPVAWSNEQLQMLNFLDGSGEFDGVWFGEKHPTEEGKFWWRKHLRRLFDTRPQAREPLTGELSPKPEWANTGSDWVVAYLRKYSIFDADQIGEMLDFAAASSAAAHGITGEKK